VIPTDAKVKRNKLEREAAYGTRHHYHTTVVQTIDSDHTTVSALSIRVRSREVEIQKRKRQECGTTMASIIIMQAPPPQEREEEVNSL
jgi:hypothetical protein